MIIAKTITQFIVILLCDLFCVQPETPLSGRHILKEGHEVFNHIIQVHKHNIQPTHMVCFQLCKKVIAHFLTQQLKVTHYSWISLPLLL